VIGQASDDSEPDIVGRSIADELNDDNLSSKDRVHENEMSGTLSTIRYTNNDNRA